MFALTLVVLSFLYNFIVVDASPCIAMDADFNLLVLGLGGKDFNAGPQSSWTGSTPALDITSSGRPPFDGANTTCFLAQFFNAVYVLSSDASNPAAVHIYDAGAKSWTVQSVTDPSASTPAFNPANFKAILDHDTNVFYALSDGQLFFLNMGDLKVANSTALTWTNVGTPSFDTTGYDPVMAVAQNHIHFLDVPGLSAGQADIFVIHFSFFQPEAQLFQANDGNNFPQQHGQATSFFLESAAQQEFAYIPDDGSATYVINVSSNTTQTLAGPPTKDPLATYFAGISSLVQLDAAGALSFLPYTAGDNAVNAQAAWAKVSTVTVPPPGSVSGPAGSSGANPKSGSGPGTGAAGSDSGTSGSNAGMAHSVAYGLLASSGIVSVSLLILL